MNCGRCIECGRRFRSGQLRSRYVRSAWPRVTAADRLSCADCAENYCEYHQVPVPAFRVGTASLKESMSRRKSSRRQLQSLCGEIRPDDGVDPRDLFRSPTNRKVTNRKTLQLCSQVADTLNLVLSGECADDVLQSLHVVAVKPAPNASQLLVMVSPSPAGQDLDPLVVLERLARANGRLRSEVAAAIVRKRAPQLVFQYVR
jgi:ribosome-binding factor A